jgi:hypothetical protein
MEYSFSAQQYVKYRLVIQILEFHIPVNWFRSESLRVGKFQNLSSEFSSGREEDTCKF